MPPARNKESEATMPSPSPSPSTRKPPPAGVSTDSVSPRKLRDGTPIQWVHTLVIGSGAAGLNAAVQLHRNGVTDLLLLTEGLRMGTSINTGSDKQTYYKLNLCGTDADAPRLMAENYFAGGSMHGDLALAEAAGSARAFLHLVGLGVPFPQDAYGQFIGYKTDHDPRKRATSIGPYTSRDMCRALIREAENRRIEVREQRYVVDLVTTGTGKGKRICGAVVLTGRGAFECYGAENVVFATGGPGGLYKTSVYPAVHTGGIGLAMLAGAMCQGLPESQYGMASTKFRWNVSGTYMQVCPRFISTDARGGDVREFLDPYFRTAGERDSMVFLKGYQWPFDPRKIVGGSSLIDILVYIETVIRGRRVWMDFRSNPKDFTFKALSDEARGYLENSKALQKTPIARLQKMNPGAIQLYLDHKIDIRRDPLEIAVCAQHNNGGLAGDAWWESLNLRHFFPVGEVNGSHGVYRPGGSALNAGQVGSIRAADCIAHVYAGWSLKKPEAKKALDASLKAMKAYATSCATTASQPWRKEREAFQERMSRAAAHIRKPELLAEAIREAKAQWARLSKEGSKGTEGRGLVEAMRNRHLCFAHLVYLQAVQAAVESGVGSRGSAVVLGHEGQPAHPALGAEWNFVPEEESFRNQVLQTQCLPGGRIRHAWVPVRPIPESDEWFETAWAAYREGRIYRR